MHEQVGFQSSFEEIVFLQYLKWQCISDGWILRSKQPFSFGLQLGFRNAENMSGDECQGFEMGVKMCKTRHVFQA